MNNFVKKAENYFVLASIAEKMDMHTEAATNYFKALSTIGDFRLDKIGLKAKDHSERFLLLKQNFPELYRITDKLFLVYRRTYTGEITKEELNLLKENIQIAFKNANLKSPTNNEFKEKIKKISKE